MTVSDQALLTIKVEGWRGISHSYSLVNQFQLLAWQKSGRVEISHLDVPFLMPHWSSDKNSAGFDEEDRTILDSLEQGREPDALYRIFAPFGLDTPLEVPTLTFAVTEFGFNSTNYRQHEVDTYAARGGQIHTPSRWSKGRLIANGVPEGIIHVVPHAADSKYFFPMDRSLVDHNRRELGFNVEDVILLNIGTHHWNKGLDLLIKSFATVRRKNKNLKLLLKDQRSTYLMNSEFYVQQILADVGMNDAETMDAIRMIPNHLSLKELNYFYNIADAYLTPYRAEGFNLPAMEAHACGTPVIATAGGATDDFLGGAGYEPISGKLIENAKLKEDLPINAYIEPNLDHLIEVLENITPKTMPAVIEGLPDWNQVCQSLEMLLKPVSV